MVTMRLRSPYITASIWKSGQITCTGAVSEDQALVAARRVARTLSKLEHVVESSRPDRQPRPMTSIYNYRVVNVLGTCLMPFAVKIDAFASTEKMRKMASYEPELHPGVTVRFQEPKATLKVFSTGSLTVTASSTDSIQTAVHKIYPLIEPFRRQRNQSDLMAMRTARKIRKMAITDIGDDRLDGLRSRQKIRHKTDTSDGRLDGLNELAYFKSECADLFDVIS